MGSFKLGGMTLRSIFKKPETILYPVVEKAPHPGLKGHISNDMVVCILCGICEKTCPASALRVNKAEKLWAINRFSCVQCGACTRACPKTCLTMETSYSKPSVHKFEDVFYKPEETEVEKEAKAAQKAAKLEAALKAKEAKQAQETTN